jgi:hypothetical protein
MFTEWHQGNGKEQDFDKTHWFAELDNKSLEIRAALTRKFWLEAQTAVVVCTLQFHTISHGCDRAFKLGHYLWLNTLDELTTCGIINPSLATIIGKGNGTRERFFKAKRARKERGDAT